MNLNSNIVCIVLTVGASLLLSACSGNNDGEISSSVIEKNPIEGIWSAPAYGKIFAFKRYGGNYSSTMFYVTDNSCLRGRVENDLTAFEIEQITRLTDNSEQIEIRRAGAVLAPGVIYTRLGCCLFRCAGHSTACHILERHPN